MFFGLLGRDAEDRQVGQHLFTWFETGQFRVDMDLLYDPLSALFLLLITGVGSLIHVYSIGYMEHDPRRRRFFGYLNLFLAAMLMLVLSANYVGLFLGWEGVGLASYLLIGFWQHKHTAAAAAKKAFVINRVGDIGLSLAIALLFVTFGTTSFEQISAVSGEASENTLTAIGVLLLLGACGKSAQVPLQAWLLDAMEGPTPVSALIHAATMVTAGVYLVVRSNFIFELAPVAQTVVVIVAVVTLLWGAVIGCAKDDIKKALAGSTMSQIGYMMLAAGLGVAGYAFAIFHLLTHGFFKANMFLGAGSVMHAMDDDVDMRHYGGPAEDGAGHVPDLRDGLSRDHRVPGILGLLVEGQDHRDRPGRELGGRPVRAARRRHHRLLHDPADADDVLHRQAVGEGCAPARVPEGHDDPAHRSGSAVGARRRAAPRRLDRRLPGARRRRAAAPRAAASRRSPSPCSPSSWWPSVSRPPGSSSGGRRCPGRLRRTSPSRRARRAQDLYGDAINEGLVVAPGRSLVSGLTTTDRHAVDGGIEGGAFIIAGLSNQAPTDLQNGFVRSYALSVLVGALLVVLALVAVNFA